MTPMRARSFVTIVNMILESKELKKKCMNTCLYW